MNRLFKKRGVDRDDRRLLMTAFDPQFYAAQFAGQPEPADLLQHYCDVGWREGRDPNAAFSSEAYLDDNRDVAKAGMNPLAHFLRYGKAEGRKVAPSRFRLPDCAPRPPANVEEAIARDAAILAEHMDLAFYRGVSGVAHADATAAAVHYLTVGSEAGLDPRPDFDCSLYLDIYPDVAGAQVNPFLHYVMDGQFDARICFDPAAETIDTLRALRPLEQIEDDWMCKDLVAPLGQDALRVALRTALAGAPRRIIVSFTHDDYRSSRGGVQYCVAREEADAPRFGACYLALFPWQPRPRHAPLGSDPLLMALVNGAEIGPAPISGITQALAEMTADGWHVDPVIHSLLGHSPEGVAEMLGATGCDSALIWIHDYWLLCPSYNLQRNTITYCDAPDVGSTACTVCLFGRERRSHLERLGELAERVSLHAVAPSRVAADMVRRKTDLPLASVSIQPHLTLRDVPVPDADVLPPKADDGVCIAFLGLPARSKGWDVFRNLTQRANGRPDVRFVHFGDGQARLPGVDAVPVAVTAMNSDAMVDALVAQDVDLVLHWALWPETFSFTATEAMRAGAYLVTNSGSGNVAALVEGSGRGAVLEKQSDLLALLDGDTIAKLARDRRERAAQSRVDAEVTDLSHAFLGRDDAS